MKCPSYWPNSMKPTVAVRSIVSNFHRQSNRHGVRNTLFSITVPYSTQIDLTLVGVGYSTTTSMARSSAKKEEKSYLVRFSPLPSLEARHAHNSCVTAAIFSSFFFRSSAVPVRASFYGRFVVEEELRELLWFFPLRRQFIEIRDLWIPGSKSQAAKQTSGKPLQMWMNELAPRLWSKIALCSLDDDYGDYSYRHRRRWWYW